MKPSCFCEDFTWQRTQMVSIICINMIKFWCLNETAPQPRKKVTKILKTEIPPVPSTSRIHTPNGSVVPSPTQTPQPTEIQNIEIKTPPVSFTPKLENL